VSSPFQPSPTDRYWSERTVLLFLIAILAVMTLAPLTHSLFTTTDDIFAFAGIGEGWRSPWFVDARRSGRLQHVFDGQLMTISYGWGIYWLQKTLAFASIIANVLTLFIMVRRISSDARVAALAVVCFFAFVQNTWDHNLLTAYPFTFHLGLTAFFLSVTAWWAALSETVDARRARRLRVISVALYVVSMFVYENFLAYVIVFPALTFLAASGGTWRDRALRALRGPHIPALVVFIVMVMLFRVLLITEEGRAFNAGEQYELSLSPLRVWKVLERYAAAAIPLQYFRVYRDLVTDFYLGYGSPRPHLIDVFRLFDVAWLVRGLIVAFLVTSLAARRTIVRHKAVLVVLAIVLIIGSNLPLAVTGKYQSWVIDSSSRGYVTAYFVFFGIVIALALLADGIATFLAGRSRVLGRTALTLIALAVFILSYGTDYVNAHVSATQERMYDRSAAVDAWMKTPGFKAIPDGSVVYAPTLWDKLYPGQTQLWDWYWDHHMMHVSRRFTMIPDGNGTSQFYPAIQIVHTFKTFAELAGKLRPGAKLYYLKAMQERRSTQTALVAAEIAPSDGVAPLRAREVSVFVHAKADRFTVLGRLLGVDTQCRGRVLVDGVPSSGTFTSDFAALVDRTRHSSSWMQSRIQGVGGTIDPESIMVTDEAGPLGSDVRIEYEPVVDAGGGGFYDDEFAHRWAEGEATMLLKNRAERPITVDVHLEMHLPAAEGGTTYPVLVTAGEKRQEWRVGEPLQQHVIRVEVPPLGQVPLAFKTTAPRVPGDGRHLVMMFAMPVRTTEVSCAATDSQDARNVTAVANRDHF
jgi:hypothetical protein